MKRLLLIAVIALTMIGLFAASQTLLAKSPSTGSSATASETMHTANQLYEAGQYDQAIQAYQHLADQGYAESALFYNLGNAYFKQADYGRAVLNYRRAQRLAPRDADIEANLNLARAQAVDQLEAAEAGGLMVQVGNIVRSMFTLDELAMFALGVWFLFMFLLILFGSAKAGGSMRSGLQYVMVAAAVVLAVGTLALGGYLYVDGESTSGVVVAAEVNVTSGPGAQYLTEFTLHSGAEVDLVEARGSWVRLALPGAELEGWVPATAIEDVTS